jgi:hypothetical protein
MPVAVVGIDDDEFLPVQLNMTKQKRKRAAAYRTEADHDDGTPELGKDSGWRHGIPLVGLEGSRGAGDLDAAALI